MSVDVSWEGGSISIYAKKYFIPLRISMLLNEDVVSAIRNELDAFPKDVWINRVLENHYPGGFMFDKYTPYNGVMQQYLFFYSRMI